MEEVVWKKEEEEDPLKGKPPKYEPPAKEEPQWFEGMFYSLCI